MQKLGESISQLNNLVALLQHFASGPDGNTMFKGSLERDYQVFTIVSLHLLLNMKELK